MEPIDIDKVELQHEIMPIRAYAECLIIKKDEDNIQAADYLKKIKGAQRMVKDKFKAPLEAAYQAHKKLKAFQDEFLIPLETCETKIKTAMIAFEREAERERQRLQAIQEAEARRIEAEARKLQEQAANLQNRGFSSRSDIKQAAADAVQVKADEIRQAVIEKPMTRNVGISYVTTWKYEIVNPEAVPANYMMIDEKKIGQVVKATKGTLAIPGVRIYSEKQIASKSY